MLALSSTRNRFFPSSSLNRLQSHGLWHWHTHTQRHQSNYVPLCNSVSFQLISHTLLLYFPSFFVNLHFSSLFFAVSFSSSLSLSPSLLSISLSDDCHHKKFLFPPLESATRNVNKSNIAHTWSIMPTTHTYDSALFLSLSLSFRLPNSFVGIIHVVACVWVYMHWDHVSRTIVRRVCERLKIISLWPHSAT